MANARKLSYPRNLLYGTGACRRRIQLRNNGLQVVASLDDTFHEMTCLLTHDGRAVTDVSAETIRIPTSECPGAATVLRELIGVPLDVDMRELYGGGRPRRHCTHLFDLATLSIAHARRPDSNRRYDAIVPDRGSDSVTIEVWRNRQRVHAWQVQNDHVVSPPELVEMPLLNGFMAWAARHFHGDALEAAGILSKTYLISNGRRYETEAYAGQSIRMNGPMAGLCHSYSLGQIDRAIILAGNVRDYSDGIPEK
jgi:hypothetical protein